MEVAKQNEKKMSRALLLVAQRRRRPFLLLLFRVEVVVETRREALLSDFLGKWRTDVVNPPEEGCRVKILLPLFRSHHQPPVYSCTTKSYITSCRWIKGLTHNFLTISHLAASLHWYSTPFLDLYLPSSAGWSNHNNFVPANGPSSPQWHNKWCHSHLKFSMDTLCPLSLFDTVEISHIMEDVSSWLLFLNISSPNGNQFAWAVCEIFSRISCSGVIT